VAEEALKDEIRRILSVLRKKMALRQALAPEPAPLKALDPAPRPRPIMPVRDGPVKVPRRVDVIAIGSSTGGPRALEEIITKLPASMPMPIIVVQHMPPVFTKSLARNINEKSELHVCEASEGERPVAGKVYIAPGGRHMLLEKDGDGEPEIRVNDDPPENSCRPSADVLFRSLCSVYRPERVLCVVLTGMGSDGAKGVKALQDRGGGYCITQSEKSCVVYGMPRAVVEAGLVCEVLDLEEIAARIMEISMAGERAALRA
jgi:two-component system chemotaxis response regulator CheB